MIQTLIGVILGGSFLAFVQFLIQRADSKTDQYEAIVKAIAEIKKEISDLANDIGKMDEKLDMRATVEARIRILKFSDELTEGRLHSKDSFDQCMSDISQYRKYCDVHPEFKNDQTVATVNHITKCYAERLEKHDFLR